MDIDPRNGGNESLANLTAEHGALPDTPRVKTGGGGFHHWLRFPPGTKCGKPFPGIDRKAEGGYVIVPPSKIDIPEHDGRAYCWEVRPWEQPLAEAPAWLLGMKPMPKADAHAEADDPWVVREACLDLLSHPGSPEGERRKTLCQLVGVHLARGDSGGSIKAMAEAWAKRCKPPLPEWEKHVLGMLRREAGRMTTPLSPLPFANGFAFSPEAGREGTNSALASAVASELVPSLPPSAESEAGGGERLSAATPEAQAESYSACASATAIAMAKGEAERPGPTAEANGLTLTAMPTVDGSGSRQGRELEPGLSPEPVADWPLLPPEAYHGLLGEMLKAVEPETEADPAGVLLGWLCCFGSCVGRGAWIPVGPRLHHPALYVGIVGRTSDAKGDGWAVSLWPFQQVEPAWAAACIANGVGSGEGLIERVADAQTVLGKDGKAEVIPGASDKRCLLRLAELSRCFKVGRRENATLSEYLREGWDGEPISVPNRKGNALATSAYAISMVGDITPGVIRKLLESGTEAFDGTANRYLWAAVRSPRSLPMGGNILVLKPFFDRLASALAFAKQAGVVKQDAEAEALWHEVYPSLKASGDGVPHTDRARPYALRLAMLYALADSSKVIRREHLQAALALWSYCRAAAKLIFGTPKPPADPDPLWLRLLNAIAASPGVSRSGLREVAGHKTPALEIEEALALLEVKGMAYRKTVHPEGGGRPAECWYPGRGPEPENDNPAPLSAVETAAFKAEADAETSGREGTNSPPAQADAGTEAELVPSPPEPGANSPEAQAGVSLFPPSPEPEQEQEASGPGSRELVCSLPVPPEPRAEDEGKGEKRVVIQTAVQPQDNGEAQVTLEQFKAEAEAALGRWNKPGRGGTPYWQTEAAQLRWYMAYRTDQAQAEAERQERIGSAVMPEADFIAELQAML